MKVVIDPQAGFCPGVKRVIKMAEKSLEKERVLFGLGELIHNRVENERLKRRGFRIVDHSILEKPEQLGSSKKLLIRAHGEPPETFEKAREKGIEIIDGTCNIVTRSQQIAREHYLKGYQVVIIGKHYHPEVIGIVGHCDGQCKVVLTKKDLEQLDINVKTFVMAQTTISPSLFETLVTEMRKRRMNLTIKNTICRYVTGRNEQIRQFAKSCSKIVMVGGQNSSNTRTLYQECLEVNPQAYWIEEPAELNRNWFAEKDIVGITGSASTPQWLMEKIKEHIESWFTTKIKAE